MDKLESLISAEPDLSSDGESEYIQPEQISSFQDRDMVNMTVRCKDCGLMLKVDSFQNVYNIKHKCEKDESS